MPSTSSPDERPQPALTEAEVERRMSDWHDGAGDGLAAHEYLGWTWDEYAHWAETAELPERR